MESPEHALSILLELTRTLTHKQPLPDALRSVVDAGLALLPGNHASIRVLDHTRTELLSGARVGAGSGKAPVRHQPGVGIAGWVVAHGELARVADTEQDKRFVHKPNQGFTLRSMLSVPLWSAGEVVGVLSVSSSEPNEYELDHETLAQLLANCAVPPIEKARLARLAVTDAQTLAYNQAYLVPGLRAAMKQVQGVAPLSVLMIDIDKFKLVNDRYGHAAGDRALRVFADRLRKATRDHDVVVRRGGDEFVLIMPGTGTRSAEIVAERIRTKIAETAFDLDGSTVDVTVSIGASTWDGVERPEELERRTDSAMYEAKMAGRNRVRMSEATVREVPPPTERASAPSLDNETSVEAAPNESGAPISETPSTIPPKG